MPIPPTRSLPAAVGACALLAAGLLATPAAVAQAPMVPGTIAYRAVDLYGEPSKGLFTSRVDGTGLRRVAGRTARSPAWSPRGDRLAWVSDTTTEALVVARADGTGKRTVMRTAGYNSLIAPVWTRNGRRLRVVVILKSLESCDARARLVEVDPSTGRRRTVGAVPLLDNTYDCKPAPSTGLWSRNGNLLAMVVDEGVDSNSCERELRVLVHSRATGRTHRLGARGDGCATWDDFSPTFLPGNRGVAFRRTPGVYEVEDVRARDVTAGTFVGNPVTGAVRPATAAEAVGVGGVWSRTGRYVVVPTEAGVARMAPDGMSTVIQPGNADDIAMVEPLVR